MTDSFWVDLLLIGCGILALIGVVIAITIPVGRHLDHTKCDSFARNTGRETRFVVYNLFSWDCITPVGNGEWLPIDSLRDFQ